MDTLSPRAHGRHYYAYQAFWRRLAFFGLTFLTAIGGGFLMFDILNTDGMTTLALASLVLFLMLFTWIAGAFWTAVAGFVVRVVGDDPAVLHSAAVRGLTLSSRSAIVIPIYNEDTARVFAGVEAIWTSLQQQPQQSHFDFFILSDTRIAEIAAAEEAAWKALIARLGAGGRLFYRRRSENSGRKAGNVAEFVRNWGGAYDYMIVLDADSIMSGHALVSMAQLMDANPQVGIVQALPLLAGRETFFARLLQFAVRVNGGMFASGLAFWQLGEGNYWGHNAIMRLRAFAEHCALPHLPGAPPFGGDIMSHDIVEAAFMRRAGYKIWLVPDIPGSWEEVPSNVLDFAARDRRWAQGNLQHVGVMPMRGLHWLSRIHMLTGVMSYASSPMWFLVLICSSIMTVIQAVTGHQYFQSGAYSLFPSWPQYHDSEIAALLCMTVVVLFVPKLLGLLLAYRDRALRAAFGGGRKLALGALIEQFTSMLLAPSMMLFHTTFVLQALTGRSVGWNAQPRSDRGIGLHEALARHKWHVTLGVVWTAVILALAPRFIWWMLPVVIGMIISPLFTMYTSRSDIGRALRERGLLLTPEETAPPPELAALASALKRPLIPAPSGPAAGSNEPPAAVPPRVPLTMVACVPSYLPLWLPGRQRAPSTP